jgi:Na+-transporting methylmalonyl-CoA/oxaloacetate decarboxylase gamma subunit
MSLILQSLLITAIGMGLVFLLILLLWGFMGGLVALTNRWDFMAQIEAGVEEPGEQTGETPEAAAPAAEKLGIIAVAVATAIKLGRKMVNIAPVQPSATSSWQAVTRANTLSQISAIFNRKPRG